MLTTPAVLSLPACIICPRCHGLLEPASDASSIGCVACGAHYPVRGGLPILLPDEAQTDPAGDVLPSKPRRSSRLRRARNVLESQGALPFVSKLGRAGWTEVERRVPIVRRGPRFECPCCGESARFLTYRGRRVAQCPECGSKERDRLLGLVLDQVLDELEPGPSILHSAPEPTIRPALQKRSSEYMAVDMVRGLSSYAGRLSAAADLTKLPFAPESFDLVVASHVLEHVLDDRAAISEIFRVLRAGGIAVLPVPIVHGGPTIEYGAPRPDEEMHVRAPGKDYFSRYEETGFEVEVLSSSNFSDAHQLLSYHSEGNPNGGKGGMGRPGSVGKEQWIPVCRKT